MKYKYPFRPGVNSSGEVVCLFLWPQHKKGYYGPFYAQVLLPLLTWFRAYPLELGWLRNIQGFENNQISNWILHHLAMPLITNIYQEITLFQKCFGWKQIMSGIISVLHSKCCQELLCNVPNYVMDFYCPKWCQ